MESENFKERLIEFARKQYDTLKGFNFNGTCKYGRMASDPMKRPHRQKKIGGANISKSVRRKHAR